MTTEEFLSRSKELHGDKYTYEGIKDPLAREYVQIFCLTCNEMFTQRVDRHLIGRGCPECGRIKNTDGRRITLEEFAEKERARSGDCWEFISLEWVRKKRRIVHLKCKKCGNEIKPDIKDHYKNPPGCGRCNQGDDVFQRAIDMHKDDIDFHFAEYKGSDQLLSLVCKKCHRVFEQTPSRLLRGFGCRFCGWDRMSKESTMTQDQFLIAARETHGDNYDYSRTHYKGHRKKILIICNTCGKGFRTTASIHLRGCGCPNCAGSKGEDLIRDTLSSLGIPFVREKKFDGCQYKGDLRFDFYIHSKRLCIEFHGSQHYEPVDFFGGSQGLETIKIRDQIKRDFCEDNGIKLLEIPYSLGRDQVVELIRDAVLS